jgi:hypothetical protein
MRVLALTLLVFAAAAPGADRNWTSRELVLKATQTLNEKLNLFQTALRGVRPTAKLTDQWRAVKQQTEATEALVSTGAEYEEVLAQFKKLAAELTEARRLMYDELLCYHPKVSDLYQAVRLAFRRLDRNMGGQPAQEYSRE